MRYFIFLVLFFAQSIYANEFTSAISNLFSKNIYEESNVATNVFAPTRQPEKENIFIFSPSEHTWAVYDKSGQRLGLGRATGGRDYCKDTKENCRTAVGKFTVFRKEDKDCTSNTFPIDEGGGAPMPYCIFFHKGFAIHGSKHVVDDNLSHGCVRVSNQAAKWIHENYIHEGSYVLVLPYEKEKALA